MLNNLYTSFHLLFTTTLWVRNIFHIVASKNMHQSGVSWLNKKLHEDICIYHPGPDRDLWNPGCHDLLLLLLLMLSVLHDSILGLCHEKISFSPSVSYPYPSHWQVIYFFCRCVSDLTRHNLGLFFRTLSSLLSTVKTGEFQPSCTHPCYFLLSLNLAENSSLYLTRVLFSVTLGKNYSAPQLCVWKSSGQN